MTIYLTDDAFSVKAKRFNKMFTSILAIFFVANKFHSYAPSIFLVCIAADKTVLNIWCTRVKLNSKAKRNQFIISHVSYSN